MTQGLIPGCSDRSLKGTGGPANGPPHRHAPWAAVPALSWQLLLRLLSSSSAHGGQVLSQLDAPEIILNSAGATAHSRRPPVPVLPPMQSNHDGKMKKHQNDSPPRLKATGQFLLPPALLNCTFKKYLPD